MAASGSGGETARPWTATSTWAPAGDAAVENAVSFETSDEDAEEYPAGVVLTRPDLGKDGDAPPCEITVSFRGLYEIHRVYVRSTARIYEIYHSTDTKSTNKDYLCTVRCGLAAKEPQPSGEESNASTNEKREHETKSVSSSSSDDSWIDVKIPESPKRNNTSELQERNVAGTCQDNLAYYEATAEMTNVSPCVSLTVRLLSLQSKTSVHIKEIYIFADPVDSTNDDSVTGPGSMDGSSLLAMLVPGLMQRSKSRNYKIDDGYFSHGSRSQPAQDHAVKESSPYERPAQEAGPSVTDDSKHKPAGIERGIYSTDDGTVANEKNNQDQLQHKKPMSVQSPVPTRVQPVKDQLVSDTAHLANPPVNGLFNPYNHIEKKLDTLLSKVEKMELYCSRFEDSMIKPLGSIEERLQRLEQQFNSFSVEIQSLRYSSSRMSAPDGPSDANSQEKVHNDGNTKTPASITERKPGLFVRAPDFSSEDSCSYNVTDANLVNFRGPNVVPRLLVKVPEFISQPELTGEELHEGPISPVDCAQSSEQKERKISPGLVVKVPEFADDDSDDEVEEEEKPEVGDHDQTRDDTPCRNTIDSSKRKNHVSVNGALASALEALLMSTKETSSSKFVVCPASSASAENTNGSSSSLSPGNVDEMSTKDGSIDQIPGSIGNANLDGTFISCQEIDGAPHTSLSKPVMEGNVDTNEKNNHLDSDKLAFVASTVSLGVPSQHHIVEESIDYGSCVNEQNNGPKLDAMPFVTSTGPLDPPQPPAACEYVDNGAQVNENGPAVSLAEFLSARNSHFVKKITSEVCRSTNGVEMLSFERTLAGAGKNSNISQLLVKNALEFDDEDESVSSVPVGATFEGSSYVVKRHNMNRIETVSDRDFGLENSVGLNSIYCQCSATGSQKKLTENSSFDWSLNDSFSKLNGDDSWSGLSSMGSFSGARASQPVVSASTAAGKYVEDLLAGIVVSSTVTPVAGEELQKVCDLLYEYKDDMLGMTSTEKKTSKSSPSLEVVLAESSDSEAQISDDDAGIGSAQLFGSFSSDDSAYATTEPLVDVADLPTGSEAYAAALNEPLVDVVDLPTHSETAADLNKPFFDAADLPTSSETASDLNKPFFDVVDLPTSSETASGVNEPLVDVADQPTTSDTASGVNGRLANVDDLPKPLETIGGGSRGEHPNSLI